MKKNCLISILIGLLFVIQPVLALKMNLTYDNSGMIGDVSVHEFNGPGVGGMIYADTNWGADIYFTVASIGDSGAGEPNNKIGYLKFATDKIPAGSKINSAKLYNFFSKLGKGGTLIVRNTSADWSEGNGYNESLGCDVRTNSCGGTLEKPALTWRRQENLQTGPIQDSYTTIQGTGQYNYNDFISFDITQSFIASFNNNSNHELSLAIMDSVMNDTINRIYDSTSKENTAFWLISYIEVDYEPSVCPTDMFQCPDGSYVSRDPDNGCEFFECSEHIPPIEIDWTQYWWIGAIVLVYFLTRKKGK